ncbi:hypothetical protein K438DRAFT_1786324 [Mycena galopus ATCC 62051]|nr:hypothetical protein K438DRAFT_1786324 [Mycena galopus ATCC 62051]
MEKCLTGKNRQECTHTSLAKESSASPGPPEEKEKAMMTSRLRTTALRKKTIERNTGLQWAKPPRKATWSWSHPAPHASVATRHNRDALKVYSSDKPDTVGERRQHAGVAVLKDNVACDCAPLTTNVVKSIQRNKDLSKMAATRSPVPVKWVRNRGDGRKPIRPGPEEMVGPASTAPISAIVNVPLRPAGTRLSRGMPVPKGRSANTFKMMRQKQETRQFEG